MEQLFYFATTLLILGFVVRAAIRKQKRDDAVREAAFREIMLSLEEKAKREGTFVISFFDSENTKNS